MRGQTASSTSEGAAGPFPSADSVADAFALLPKTPRVCVQGLGFVGAVTVAAVADACDADGNPRFNVVGLDLDTAEGLAKIAAINSARIPIATNRSRKPAGWRISNEQTADPRYANAA
ncbi:MAG: hypothetical protein E6G31_08750, partial [Actinobacteria bacterium]